jgi:hypothetical protein
MIEGVLMTGLASMIGRVSTIGQDHEVEIDQRIRLGLTTESERVTTTKGTTFVTAQMIEILTIVARIRLIDLIPELNQKVVDLRLN